MADHVVGAAHDFHSESFAHEWAERFTPTPERLRLFDILLSELRASVPEAGRVVELGMGPGYLAEHILGAMTSIEYLGIDFSQPMLDLAGARLERYASRVSYLRADLVRDDWPDRLPRPVHAVVSTWALHDLGGQQNTLAVYRASAEALGDKGVFLNGDFVKPDRTAHVFEPGRFETSRHLELLRTAGFRGSECLAMLEQEIESPTPAQNYACLKAIL